MFINQLACLADAVADKLGRDYTSCRRSGFIDALATAGMKILVTMEKRLRSTQPTPPT
jgi:hypothetical protein